jgi:hypothetical protein
MTDKRSTISKTVLPVGESTRELYAAIQRHVGLPIRWTPENTIDTVLDILAEADERDCYAVSNLLYAWRTGQLT